MKDQQDAEVLEEGQRGQPADQVKEHAIDITEEEEDDTREEVFTLTPKSKNEASLATYAGDYDLKRSLVDTMLKKTPTSVNMRRSKSCVKYQVKMDMRPGFNRDSYVDLDYKEKVEMCKLRAKIYE